MRKGGGGLLEQTVKAKGPSGTIEIPYSLCRISDFLRVVFCPRILAWIRVLNLRVNFSRITSESFNLRDCMLHDFDTLANKEQNLIILLCVGPMWHKINQFMLILWWTVFLKQLIIKKSCILSILIMILMSK